MKNKINKINWIIYPLLVIIGLVVGGLLFDIKPGKETEDHEHIEGEAEEIMYTCSMHPQIRQNEPGQCPICGMDLIPVKQGSAGSVPQMLVMTEASVKLADIQTTPVKSNVPLKEVQMTGKVRVDETQLQQIIAQFPGRIERLYVNFTGEKVRAGAPVALIYSPELLTAQKELLEASKFRETNPALFEAAKNKLQLWKISNAQINQILQQGEVKAELPIYSTASGVVTERKATVGDYLMKGEPIMTVADLGTVWVEFDAYESDLAFIQEGSNISFSVPSLPGEKFNAKVEFVDPLINPNTRTASVRVEVNNRQGLLKPEMFARGTLESNIKPGGTELVIPKTAVMWTGTRSVVYVRIPGTEVPTFEYREVELGSLVGDHYIVKEGLDAGELVVSNGTFTVDAAAQLSNKSSMMNQHITIKGEKITRPSATFDFTEETPQPFKDQLSKALNTYISLKDALVASQPAAVQKHAATLLQDLEKINMGLLNGKPHEVWMSYLEVMQQKAQEIKAADNIDVQRKAFIILSKHMIYAAQTFGTNEALYIQRCPMANDNQGADWLSRENVVRNPYYGEMMMTCGDVIEKISN